MPGYRVMLREARTVRGMMLLAAVACLLACGAKLLVRRITFLKIAEAHASRVLDYGENREIGCWKDEFLDERNLPRSRLSQDFALRLDALRDYYAKLERKYRSAAARPWLVLERDPLAP